MGTTSKHTLDYFTEKIYEIECYGCFEQSTMNTKHGNRRDFLKQLREEGWVISEDMPVCGFCVKRGWHPDVYKR